MSSEAKSRLFHGADLFVLPSHSESFGIAIAEALAHSLPVLTTTAAPWSGLVEKGCGWRVEPSVEGLAQGLALATSIDTDKLRAMGSSGRRYVESEYSWGEVAQRFIQLYEELAR